MKWWDKISDIGRQPNMEPDEIRNLHLVNRTLLIGTLVSCMVAPLIALQGNALGFWAQVVTTLLLVLGFIFSVYRHYNSAMVYMLVVFMGNLTLASLLTPEILVEFYLIPLSIAAPAVLKSNRIAIIMFLACLMNYLLIEHYNDLIPKMVHMDSWLVDLTYVVDAVLIFTITFFLFIVLRQTNAAYEQRIIKQKEHIEEQNHEIKQSITYAKRIQTAILPPDELFVKHLPHSFVLYKPKDIVAGDFYFLEPVDNLVVFAAADCTGHGVPGAMVSVICNNALNRSVREFKLRKPEQILDKTRELVISEFDKSVETVQDGMDISLCVLNKDTNELWWAGANNPLWILRKDADDIEQFKPDKQPIAHYEGAKPFTGNSVQLNEGDSFYIFSDGYQDQFGGPSKKKYRPAQLRKKLLEIKNEDIHHQQLALNREFENWRGDEEQVDDVCMIGVRI